MIGQMVHELSQSEVSATEWASDDDSVPAFCDDGGVSIVLRDCAVEFPSLLFLPTTNP
jgi:hypothetical protein